MNKFIVGLIEADEGFFIELTDVEKKLTTSIEKTELMDEVMRKLFIECESIHYWLKHRMGKALITKGN